MKPKLLLGLALVLEVAKNHTVSSMAFFQRGLLFTGV